MPTEDHNPSLELMISTPENHVDYDDFLSENASGIRFILTPDSHQGTPCLTSDAGDFAKWIRQEYPSIPVSFPESAPKLLLRGADIWLPMVYLAGDASIQVFLNMVASYLYDRLKGARKEQPQKIHFSVMHLDERAGVVKKLEFSGEAENLSKIIQQFNTEKFFE